MNVSFHGTNDDDYRAGVIKEVTDSLLKLSFKMKDKKGKAIVRTTYIDISSIKIVLFRDPGLFDENDFIIDENQEKK